MRVGFRFGQRWMAVNWQRSSWKAVTEAHRRHYASSAIENVNSMFTATFLKKADRLVMTDEDYKLVWFGLLHPTTPSRRIYNGLHSHCPRCHHSAASPPLNIHRHLYRKSERVSAA